MPVLPDRSHMASAEYDEPSRTALVTYKNGYQYRVHKLPKFHFVNMMKAQHPGSYFHSRIRGTFEVERIA